MKRFILTSEPDKNGSVRLTGDDYHYLVRVRRLAPGEFFPALLPGSRAGNPNGEEVLIQVLSVEGGTLTGRVSTPAPVEPVAGASASGAIPIILLQALPKGDKMDLIVRQAAEGGVAEIVPFVSEFSLPKLKGGQGRKNAADADGAGAKKTARWERIIKEARQQSGSGIATAIQPPLSLDALFGWWERFRRERPGSLGLLFHHLPLAQASLHGYLDTIPEAVALAIGPEGGFSPAEAARFLEAGFKPLTIGDTILRTETAALYCAAAVRVILLESNSWQMKQAPLKSEKNG
jgi:16S rRNA (uracil1498-N3)-methyltransferase